MNHPEALRPKPLSSIGRETVQLLKGMGKLDVTKSEVELGNTEDTGNLGSVPEFPQHALEQDVPRLPPPCNEAGDASAPS